MYIYINKELDLYPRFPGDIQLIDPTWTVDKPLPEGWELVEDTPTPVYEFGQIAEELAPEKVDGVWRRVWQVRNLTEEELDEQRLIQQQMKEYLDGNI